MSDVSQGPGWWQASDGRWYPPKESDEAPAPGWWLASNGKWYPPLEVDRSPAPGWWLASDGNWYPPAGEEGDRRRPPSLTLPWPDLPEPSVESPHLPATEPSAADRSAASPRPPAAAPHPPAAERSSPRTDADGATPPSPGRPRTTALTGPPTSPGSAEAHLERGPRSVDRVAARGNRARLDAVDQIRARDEASRADAATQAGARFRAASRAVAALSAELSAGSAGADADTHAGSDRRDDEAARANASLEASGGNDPTVTSTTRVTQPPSPCHAAPEPSADERPAASDETPLIELRSSPIGADLDHLGDRLAVFEDRVELRDRGNRVRQSLAGADLTEITVHRKFTGAVLVIESAGGEHISIRGLRPEQADQARTIIYQRTRRQRPAPRHAETGAPGSATATGLGPRSAAAAAPSPEAAARLAILNRDQLDEADLLRKLADLHRAGVLTDAEFEAKISLVGRLVSGEALVVS